MIDMRTQKPGETPPEISISMVITDLSNGINKSEIAIKYGIKAWEVDEMFKHPELKGRRPARKRILSFKFVDDVSTEAVKEIIEEVDPNQVTLEQAIDDAIDTVGEVKNQMQETQEAILDMLSPTEFETPEETLLKASSTIEDPEFTPPSIEDTLELVEEQEEELKMDDDGSFEIN